MPFRKKMTEFDGNLWPPEPSLEGFRDISFANPVASGHHADCDHWSPIRRQARH
jgi:hypothetical protein